MNSTDLNQCEKEPIHIPGMIQPHGQAISYNKKSFYITGISQNFENAHTLLGKNLKEILDDSICKTLENLQNDKELNQQILYHTSISKCSLFDGEARYDIVFNNCGSEVMLEFTNSPIEIFREDCRFSIADNFGRILPNQSLEEICNQGVLEIKKITDFDRVMIYRFDDEFNGCVIAEAKSEDMQTYLNLSFPSSDIPAQARELYRKQTIRIIRDVNYKSVDFIRDSHLKALDMTYGHLRSVSPVHIEYLKNMGVTATLTISIIIDGKLWGLVACHHKTQHKMTLRKLEYTRAFGIIFSGMLETRLDGQYQRRSVYLLSTLDAIVSGIQVESIHNKTLFDILYRHAPMFHGLFTSNSFVLIINEEILNIDNNCTNDEIVALKDHIIPLLKDNFFYSHDLKSVYEKAPKSVLSECSGLLMVRIIQTSPSYWIWFRREKTQTLTWGGDPKNKIILNADGKISPRKSFAAFKEIVRYRSDSWYKADIDFIPDFISIVLNLYKWFDSQSQINLTTKKIRDMEDEKTIHYGELLESLVDMIEKRDAYTAGHTGRVANYCLMISSQMGLKEDEKSQLYEAAILHDIGKVVVPDAILLKPGKLTNSEYSLIKTHLIAGYQILKRISYYAPLAEIMRYHHEKYDGSGYPDGAKEDEIPLPAHIMIVADAIDAMTSNRIYQSRKSMKEALDEIVLYRGIWYDPAVVDATIVALKSLKEDSNTSQMPLTPLEKARFSYYFKDQLTGAYNESYLKMITDSLINDLFFTHFILAEIRGMSNFNTVHGWHAGDNYIQEIALQLQDLFPSERIFRVFGDDFLVGCLNLDEMKKFKVKLLKENIESLFVTDKNVHEVISMFK